MSYSLDYPVAAAPANERVTFIRRTYAHLAGAILAFAGLEAVLLNTPGIENMIKPMMGSRMSWLVVIALWMGASYMARVWANSPTSTGMQYLGLGLYIVANAIVFLPLLYVAAFLAGDPYLIPTAGILTLGIFGGLTTACFVTKKDFSFLAPVLCIGGFAAIGLLIAGALFGFSLGIWFAFAMVALSSAAIIYDTSNIIHHYRVDQHVGAALELFASVAMLFYYILIILMSSSRD